MRIVCKNHYLPVKYVFKAENKVYLCPKCFTLIEEKDVVEVK